MLVGYVRVSSVIQNLDSQIEVMKTKGITTIFQEKKSAHRKWKDRTELMRALEYLREGDVLCVVSSDRLVRGVNEFFHIVSAVADKKCKVMFLDSGKCYPSEDLGDKLLITMMALVAEIDNDIRRKAIARGKAASDSSKWKRRGPSAYGDDAVQYFHGLHTANQKLQAPEMESFNRLMVKTFGKRGKFPKDKIPSSVNMRKRMKEFELSVLTK